MFGYRSFLGCAPGAKLQLTCICLVCVLDLALSYCDAHCVALMYEIASTKMDLSILTPVCKYPRKTLIHFSKVADKKGERPSAPVFRQSAAHSLFTKSSTFVRSLRAECANAAFATESTHPLASARDIFCRSWSTSLVQLTDRDRNEMEIYSICVVNY